MSPSSLLFVALAGDIDRFLASEVVASSLVLKGIGLRCKGGRAAEVFACSALLGSTTLPEGRGTRPERCELGMICAAGAFVKNELIVAAGTPRLGAAEDLPLAAVAKEGGRGIGPSAKML